METFNAACDKISEIAFKDGRFDIYSIHKLVYFDIRADFHLPAQLTIGAIAKVIESYGNDKADVHLFKKRGCLIYDNRNLRIKGNVEESLTTLEGRVVIPMRYRAGAMTRGHI